MQSSQSFSQPYSDEFESAQQFQKDLNDNQKSEPLTQKPFEQANQSSGRLVYSGDLKIKKSFANKQTQQTASPVVLQNPTNTKGLNNRFLVSKRHRPSIGSQNIDRKQFIQKLNSNQNAAIQHQVQEKLPNLAQAPSVNQQNGFKRTRINNHRRSLHIVMSDKKIENEKKQKDDLFVKNKIKSITSYVNSARRYVAEDENIQNNGVNTSLNPVNQGQKEAIISLARQKLHFMPSRIERSSKSRNYNKSVNQIFSKDQSIYKEPERNSQRTVVFIKTYVISSFQSISLEMSVLDGSIVIIGKLLGRQIDTLKLVLNPERSESVLAESFNDWQILGKRIYVEANQSGVKKLKIAHINSVISTIMKQDISEGLNENASTTLSSKTKHKNLLFIKQTQFLQRNYYSLMSKNDQTLMTKQCSDVNSVNPSNQNTINHKQNNLVQNTPNKQQKSPSINFKQHLAKLSKHLDYFSPEIKLKVNQYQREKQNQKSRNKQSVIKQLQERQALAKRQRQQIQRLSKPKETIKQNERQTIGSKLQNNKNERTISKDKKFNVKAMINQKPSNANIRKSTNLKDAQSKISIKMSHFEAEKDYEHKISELNQQQKVEEIKQFKGSTNSKKDFQEWKKITMQKTQSIEQIGISDQPSKSEDNSYSEFESQVNKLYPSGRAEEDIYGEPDFEPKSLEKKAGKGFNKLQTNNKESKEQMQIMVQKEKPLMVDQDKAKINAKKKRQQNSSQKSNHKEKYQPKEQQQQNSTNEHKKSAKSKQKYDESQQIDSFIHDQDQEQYEKSFDQFKEQKPSNKRVSNREENSNKPNKSSKQITLKSQQIYQDQFLQDQQQGIKSSKVQDSLKDEQFQLSQTKRPQIINHKNTNQNPGTNKIKSEQQNKQYQENYDEQDYENILEENDLLDDNQIINKIQQDYLDEDFDN